MPACSAIVRVPEPGDRCRLPGAVGGEPLQRIGVEDVDHVEHRRRSGGTQRLVELGAPARQFGREHQHPLAQPAQGVGATQRAPDGVDRGQPAPEAHERPAQLDHPSPSVGVGRHVVDDDPEPRSRTGGPSVVKPASASTSPTRSLEPDPRSSS